jgi:hypothetical protein
MEMKKIGWLCLLFLLVSWNAGAASIYKYRAVDGRTLYSEKPVAHAHLVAVLHVQDPSSQAASLKRVAQERQQSQLLYEQIMESRRIDLLAAESTQAADSNGCAPSGRYGSVLEPRPGERTGTIHGRSRLNEAYWNRLGIYPAATICSVPCID